jgi:hypothetical protein
MNCTDKTVCNTDAERYERSHKSPRGMKPVGERHKEPDECDAQPFARGSACWLAWQSWLASSSYKPTATAHTGRRSSRRLFMIENAPAQYADEG